MSYANNLEFIIDRGEILKILTRSKDQGNAVGINSRSLGPGTYITAVEDIMLEEDIVIVFKPYDASGHMLEKARLTLAEIQSVLPFNSAFQNPFYKVTQFSNNQAG